MTKVIMWISEHYICVSIMLGIWLWLLCTFNYTIVYKEDGRYIYEATIGQLYSRAEYGDGYTGKYIIDNKEVYAITLK
jgi:hypothetical protein